MAAGGEASAGEKLCAAPAQKTAGYVVILCGSSVPSVVCRVELVSLCPHGCAVCSPGRRLSPFASGVGQAERLLWAAFEHVCEMRS